MQRHYRYFLLTYFHNSSKKAHNTKYSIKSTINSTEAKIKLSFQNTAPELQCARPVVCPVGPSCFSETERIREKKTCLQSSSGLVT